MKHSTSKASFSITENLFEDIFVKPSQDMCTSIIMRHSARKSGSYGGILLIVRAEPVMNKNMLFKCNI